MPDPDPSPSAGYTWVPPAPANPIGVSGAGASTEALTTSSYSKVLLSSEDSLAENGILVYDSTAPSTSAVTGVVIDESGAVVVGAQVTLTPTGGGASLVAVTDTDGAFAFVDIPVAGVSQRYDMRVVATGFGQYQIRNDVFESNVTYTTAVELNESSQDFDESGTITSDMALEQAGSGSSAYPSDSKVPATIKVAMYDQSSTCARSSGAASRSRNYPWRFYVLHVAVAEIDTRWQLSEWRAVSEAIQTYAWKHRTVGDKSFPKQGGGSVSAPVDNTTNYQCFRPQRKIPTSWGDRLSVVLETRVADSKGKLIYTYYRAGSYACSETTYPKDGGTLSQNGARARGQSTTTGCGGDESWKDIVDYYYVPSVKAGVVPGTPTISSSRISGGVRLNFDTTGGWKYEVEWYITAERAWHDVALVGWSSSQRKVKDSVNVQTGACFSYRVRALNPVGASGFANYGTLCP